MKRRKGNTGFDTFLNIENIGLSRYIRPSVGNYLHPWYKIAFASLRKTKTHKRHSDEIVEIL